MHYRPPHVTAEDKTGCCYVSRQWMHKFETFADAGPVDNHDFLCQHGGMSFHFKLLMFMSTLSCSKKLSYFHDSARRPP